MARKIMSDGTLCGYVRYIADYGGECGSVHFPSFDDPKYANFCAIPDCYCRDIAVWKAHHPSMTRYRIRKLRKDIRYWEKRWGVENTL